jgi:cell division protein FtsB
LLVYGIFFSARGIQAYQKQQQQVASVSDARSKLARDNQRMLNKIRLLKNDPRAQERLIKRELGWVHEDEVIIEFANPNPGEPEPGK